VTDRSEPLHAFTAQHVSRLTGLSDRQLRYWDGRGFFRPTYADENRRRPYSRIYSFRDVVGLRTIALLLRQYRIPFGEVAAVGRWLSEQYETPWASLKFFVVGRTVAFEDPETGERLQARPPHQGVLPIEIGPIEHEMREAAEQLRHRQPKDIGQIHRHRYVVHNADVVAGTRIPTAVVWEFHEDGYDADAIMQQYPTLKKADIAAAIEHEAGLRAKKAG